LDRNFQSVPPNPLAIQRHVFFSCTAVCTAAAAVAQRHVFFFRAQQYARQLQQWRSGMSSFFVHSSMHGSCSSGAAACLLFMHSSKTLYVVTSAAASLCRYTESSISVGQQPMKKRGACLQAFTFSPQKI